VGQCRPPIVLPTLSIKPRNLHNAATPPSSRDASFKLYALHCAALSIEPRSLRHDPRGLHRDQTLTSRTIRSRRRSPSRHRFRRVRQIRRVRRFRHVHTAHHHPPRLQSPATNTAVAAVGALDYQRHRSSQPSAVAAIHLRSHHQPFEISKVALRHVAKAPSRRTLSIEPPSPSTRAASIAITQTRTRLSTTGGNTTVLPGESAGTTHATHDRTIGIVGTLRPRLDGQFLCDSKLNFFPHFSLASAASVTAGCAVLSHPRLLGGDARPLGLDVGQGARLALDAMLVVHRHIPFLRVKLLVHSPYIILPG
jgi:hypothetical protein